MRLLSTLIIFSIILTSCKNSNTKSTQVLQVPLRDDISTLDPANSYDTISASIVYQVYEQLYEYHYLKRPYTLQPLLAVGMPKIENNGKRYIIKIRKNVRYHDNSAFNGKPRFVIARDFVNQLKRLAFVGTRSNGWWLFDGKIVGINDFRKNVGSDLKNFEKFEIRGLSTPDDHTLIINLINPYPQMLWALAMSFSSPIPIEAIRKHNNNLNEQVIGTGPFYLEKWRRRHSVELKKFSHYREAFYPGQGDRKANASGLLKDAGQKIPFLEGVKFSIIKESRPRWLQFMSGNIDFLVIPKDNYSDAVTPSGKLTDKLKAKNIHLHAFPTQTYWWLSFNMEDPLLGKNLNLRKAIAHAVDVDKYVQIFTNNVGQKANSIYIPGINGYDPSHQSPYKYDLAKAKDYLEKAGYPNGENLPSIRYDVRGSSATNRQQAEFIKNELSKIGIKIKFVLNTFPTFLKKSRAGQLQFWLDGWAMDYPDAENSLQLLASVNASPGPNATSYKNKKVDEYFNRLRLLQDGPEKSALMKKIEAEVENDLPWKMLYYARTHILYHDKLQNFRTSDLIYNYVKYLKIKK